MKIYKEFDTIGVAILVSRYELEYETRQRFVYGEIMRFLFCDYANDSLKYAIFADNDNNYYCVDVSKGGVKMFEKDIVTTATHGIAHNDTTHNIIKKKRAKKHNFIFGTRS